MAVKKKQASPPSAEAREELLTAIRATAEPLMAAPLVKLLPAAHRMAAADAVQILDEYAAAGKLFVYPPKTAKGKPRYWDRDSRAIARPAVLEAVQRSGAPFTAKALAGQLNAPVKLEEPELTQLLKELVTAETLHAFPPATAKGPPRYWHRDALEFGRRAIMQALDAKGRQTEAQLRKAAKGLGDAQFQQIMHSSLAAGDLWRHPPLKATGKELFGRKPPSPEPYLREIGVLLTKAVARLNAAQVPQDDVRRAIVQLVEAAGIPFAGARVAGTITASSPPAAKGPPRGAPTAQAGAVDLIALMKRIEPGAERGALVVSRDLRRAAHLQKAQFDEAVLELARQQKISLHRHDFVTSLSSEERDELVTDGNGTYYVGMALRQS